MNFRYKIWIEKDENTVFGPGLFYILSLTAKTGSLLKATQVLNMNYRGAWGKVRDCEKRLGFKLLQMGRPRRDGSNLTEKCKEILSRFQELMNEMDKVVSESSLSNIMDEIEKIHMDELEMNYPDEYYKCDVEPSLPDPEV